MGAVLPHDEMCRELCQEHPRSDVFSWCVVSGAPRGHSQHRWAWSTVSLVNAGCPVSLPESDSFPLVVDKCPEGHTLRLR